jgi:hypothetical protein
MLSAGLVLFLHSSVLCIRCKTWHINTGRPQSTAYPVCILLYAPNHPLLGPRAHACCLICVFFSLPSQVIEKRKEQAEAAMMEAEREEERKRAAAAREQEMLEERRR